VPTVSTVRRRQISKSSINMLKRAQYTNVQRRIVRDSSNQT
jgi:hypothetical protein